MAHNGNAGEGNGRPISNNRVTNTTSQDRVRRRTGDRMAYQIAPPILNAYVTRSPKRAHSFALERESAVSSLLASRTLHALFEPQTALTYPE